MQDRLREWQRTHYDSQAQFAASVGLSASTVKAWLAKHPRAPDLAALIQLANREGLSIDWILTGEGPELRGASRSLAGLEGELHALLARACATGYLEGYAGEIQQFLPPVDELLGWLTERARERIERGLVDRAKSLHQGEAGYLRYLISRFGDGALAALYSLPDQMRVFDGPGEPGDPALLRGMFPDDSDVDPLQQGIVRDSVETVLELRRKGKDAAMAAGQLATALEKIANSRRP